jgi:type IV secretory pathway VirB6-like protein
MKNALKWTGITLLICTLLAAVAAAVIAGLATYTDAMPPGQIGFGDAWSVKVDEHGMSGNLSGLGLWLVLTLSFLVVIGAVAFSLVVVVAAFVGTGLLMLGLAALFTAPIWIVLLLIWVTKRLHARINTPSAAAANPA